jgi:hypothetical protein
MMGASGIGDPQEQAFEEKAKWFKRTTSGKLIWPGQKYVVVKTYYDAMGRPPIYGQFWDRIYTTNEYLIYELTKDSIPRWI